MHLKKRVAAKVPGLRRGRQKQQAIKARTKIPDHVQPCRSRHKDLVRGDIYRILQTQLNWIAHAASLEQGILGETMCC